MVIPPPLFSSHVSKKNLICCVKAKMGNVSSNETVFGIFVMSVSFCYPNTQKSGFYILPCEYVTGKKGYPLDFLKCFKQ